MYPLPFMLNKLMPFLVSTACESSANFYFKFKNVMKTHEEIKTLNETFKDAIEDYMNSTNCTNCIFENTCDDYQLNAGYSLCESFKTLDNLNIE